ncbi:MAG: hypothetical protein IPG08_10060 [Sphingobacteriaceae bacterium]|nr:hypothetical protein [Sphingobacteriaceae bacterium]
MRSSCMDCFQCKRKKKETASSLLKLDQKHREISFNAVSFLGFILIAFLK